MNISKKHYIVGSILITGFLFVTIQGTWLMNPTYDTMSKASMAEFSPQDIVALYINGAVRGNQGSLTTLVTRSPETYAIVCEKNVTDKRLQDFDLESMPRILHKRNMEEEDEEPNTTPALILSKSLHAMQNVFERYEVLRVFEYNDEARVDINLYFKNLRAPNQRVFMLHRDAATGWKIFATVDPNGVVHAIDNLNYAKERVPCLDD